MEITIVPDIINSNDIEIFDVNGMEISLCKKSKYKFNYNRFKTPFILIDVFQKMKYKNVEIKTINMEQLFKFGYRIVSLKTNGRIRNRPRQTKTFMLEFLENVIPNSEVLLKCPTDHQIEHDFINNRIRLKGPSVYPYSRAENATPWINVVTEAQIL